LKVIYSLKKGNIDQYLNQITHLLKK
jgi:hypothetical protein